MFMGSIQNIFKTGFNFKPINMLMMENLIEEKKYKKKNLKKNFVVRETFLFKPHGSPDFYLFAPTQASGNTWDRPTLFSFE